ncbi:hypothetical protein FG93_04564 [Bosea sp. LC85]|nr:hypothetical protein FG93_04564 [Bosea sp. LC85]
MLRKTGNGFSHAQNDENRSRFLRLDDFVQTQRDPGLGPRRSSPWPQTFRKARRLAHFGASPCMRRVQFADNSANRGWPVAGPARRPRPSASGPPPDICCWREATSAGGLAALAEITAARLVDALIAAWPTRPDAVPSRLSCQRARSLRAGGEDLSFIGPTAQATSRGTRGARNASADRWQALHRVIPMVSLLPASSPRASLAATVPEGSHG